MNKLSWKVLIPLMLLWAIGGIGVWFLPDARCYYGNDHIFWNYILPSLASITAFIGILMTLVWFTFGDKGLRAKE